jgi:molybdopterin-guanine dinucleotide biosynthesis protein B
LNRRLAVAFTGPSNSGKTTLIEKLAKILIHEKSRKVLIIKNDPKDKAIFDKDGKDSDKFSKTGADVFVTSPTRTTFFSQQPNTIDEMIEKANKFDYLLVEGLKTLPLPRVGIFRNRIDVEYLDVVNAIAIDNSIKLEDYNIPSNITVLDLNSPLDVLEWIENIGKEV